MTNSVPLPPRNADCNASNWAADCLNARKQSQGSCHTFGISCYSMLKKTPAIERRLMELSASGKQKAEATP